MGGLAKKLIMASGGETPPGQVAFTTPGTYSWVVPDGVYSVSVVCVGGGSVGQFNGTSGGGGGLGYRNNIPVTPGGTHTVVVGEAGYGLVLPSYQVFEGESSYFKNTATVMGGGASVSSGGVYTGDGGGRGGAGQSDADAAGGGGAGGYSGDGGRGSYTGTDGEGGGGGGGSSSKNSYNSTGGGGGGVGILGQGANGAAGYVGGGGSGGQSGLNKRGGLYGGGGGGVGQNLSPSVGAAGHGAVRIIWPGDLRQFPSTRTADE